MSSRVEARSAMSVPLDVRQPIDAPGDVADRRVRSARHRLGRARARRQERGATAVEFALIVPVLVALVFGVIDFGLYINAAAVVANAGREGVRAGSLGSSSVEIENLVLSSMSDLPGDPAANTTVTTTCRTPGGSACGSYDADALSGGAVIVDISYVHTWLTPFAFGTDITINKSSEMRIE